MRFLREIDEKTTTVSDELLAIPEIAQAVELAEESAYSPGELELYDTYWDSVRREKTLMIDKYDEGKIAGEAIGEARGEANKGLNVAKKLIKLGVAMDIIIDATGLSREDIQGIKDSADN